MKEPHHTPINESDNEPATKGDIKRAQTTLKTEIDGVDQRLMVVETDVKEVKGKLESLDGRVERVEGRLESVEGKLDGMNRSIHARLDDLVGLVSDIPERVSKLEKKATFRH